MEKIMDVGTYICHRYEKQFGEPISEMKLHKLMYFAQRESIIQTGDPLFEGTFYGWKYGPVLKEMRAAFADGSLFGSTEEPLSPYAEPIMDEVFKQYAPKDAWSLSRLTHGEFCWKKSREGVPESENSDRPIRLEDIAVDAGRIRERRENLAQLGLS